MTVRKAIAYEERNIGNPVHLVDYKRMKAGILVILYYMDSESVKDLGVLRSYRLSTFQGDTLITSSIIKSIWRSK